MTLLYIKKEFNFALTVFVAVIIIIFAMVNFANADDNIGDEIETKSVENFNQWLVNFKGHAIKQGISQKNLDMAFKNVRPLTKVIGYDRNQPEFNRTFWTYLNNGVSKARISRGKKLLIKHKKLFAKIYKKYGVQPRFLVAFWGMETNFGDYTGGMPVIASLATLAYDQRRRDFFSKELIHALHILDENHINLKDMQGSWAGAMGQTQFMPSTFVNYAVDGDGDGKKDIWNSLEDIFASSANYLSEIGWDGGKTWGREVKLPSGFDLELIGNNIKKSLSYWQKIGVSRANGNDLPNVDISGSIILPAGHKGPAFMIYDNYNAIMIWNRSHSYALSVGHLSDRLNGKGALIAKKPIGEKPISRIKIIDMQTSLNILGFNLGKADGVVGMMTSEAIRNFQRIYDLPADGYPTIDLINSIISRAKDNKK